jgi:hypothetical protein
MINITFSKFVKMNGRLWEVNFRKLSSREKLFYADTATLQGERIQFHLEQSGNSSWSISGSHLPEWLTACAQEIGAAIELGMKEHYPSIFQYSQTTQAGVL